jgi:cytochrome c peroxidase
MRNSEYKKMMSGIAIALLMAAGCARKEKAIDPAALAIFAPLPQTVPAKAGRPVEERVALGRMLFYDERLSKSQKISCNSCHDLARYGVDGEATSKGHRDQRGNRNAPTVYNAAAHFSQFWDGRAADVEAQAKGPILNPIEMAMPSDKAVIVVLKSIPDYVQAFQRAFPEAKNPVTYDNMAIAIGAFERGLLTPARWDGFLRGDQAALTSEEKAGLSAFLTTGCGNCHAGALLGGNLYQKIGALKDYPDASDPGRFKVTGNEADRMTFKVPSLRNIAKTGPYFHNGKVPTLDQAVTQMADYQLGKRLSPADVDSIVKFLNALTGEIPAQYIQKPELPKSTAKTPKPQEAD